MHRERGSTRVALARKDLIECTAPRARRAAFEKADVWPYLGYALWDRLGFAGHALTLIALVFGAQFRFDGLKRLTGLRTKPKGDGGRTESQRVSQLGTSAL